MNLENLLHEARSASIAVIGDVCLDAYVFASEERSELSVETGLRTRSVKKFTFDLGGAGNIAINLRRLGLLRVDLFGLVGSDAYGGIVGGILEREGIGSEGLLVQNGNWSTHAYQKLYLDGEEGPRLDFGNFNLASEDSMRLLLEKLERGLSSYDAVVVNEQVPSGIHRPYFREGLARLMSKREGAPIWICDCRSLNDVYRNCVHKLNLHEARSVRRAYAGEKGEGRIDDATVVEWLYAHWSGPLIVTRGENGAMLRDGEGLHEIEGLQVIERIDTVGAGDAFLAAASACLASGASLEDSARVGNLAAADSIRQLYQTGHPAPAAILELGNSPDLRYHPEAAADLRLARFISGTEIEVVDQGPTAAWRRKTKPIIAIFDHDGTISTLRQGWEAIMTKVMIDSILGDKKASVSTSSLAAVEKAVRDLIDRTTGVQTILQMKALRKLVVDFAYAKEPSRPEEYKAIFNVELLAMVEARLARLRRGALSVDDFTIKGSVAFLRRLSDAGVRLCLASGSDVDDVRREAELLGYAECFDGGIHGSVGDPDRDPKRIVLDRLLGEASGIEASRCVVFGDGPVEMREAKKRGALAIGVASDEGARFGMNPVKRPRLVLGGADLLIPDFSWADDLVGHLGWEL